MPEHAPFDSAGDIEIPEDSNIAMRRESDGLVLDIQIGNQAGRLLVWALLFAGMYIYFLSLWGSVEGTGERALVLFLLLVVGPGAGYAGLLSITHSQLVVVRDGFRLEAKVAGFVLSTRIISKDVCGGVIHYEKETRNGSIPCVALWDGTKAVPFGMDLSEEDRDLIIAIVDGEVERLRFAALSSSSGGM